MNPIRLSRPAIVISGALLVVLAAYLGASKVTSSTGDDARSSTAGPSRSYERPAKDERLNKVSLGVTEIIRLGPEDWKERFAGTLSNVPARNQSDIIELSAELELALERGLDPAADDAQVYGETMLVLLRESLPSGEMSR